MSDKYAYRVLWSEEDGQYVGLCTEFPSLSWLADTRGEALRGIELLVGQIVEDMIADEEIPPEPLARRRYSGTFNLRLGAELHREIAIAAAEQGVSLQTYCWGKLRAR